MSHIEQVWILNTNKQAMNTRKLFCNFVDLSQGSLYQRLFNSKVVSKSKMLSRHNLILNSQNVPSDLKGTKVKFYIMCTMDDETF